MATSSIVLKTLGGAELLPLLPALARLRITVFREYPYLYDGDEGYEAEYLRTYAASPQAGVIVAFDGTTPVGAATCLPLADETDNVTAPFRARGWDPARFFYFGESVLLPAYRGQGLGVGFFAAREAHARAVSSCDFATFCAVRRPADHPARPASWQPLDTFWRRRGFSPDPGLACTMSWKEVGEPAETSKTLAFWVKSLSGADLP
ncbi:GNAT family N-acetyltransferase [Rhodovastum atsumiense]|uniref:GNAT family N-acetyltransferase n=1 Tax=Rhodovastum atsumiense TaxID=504468 RepID=A0A5M6INZ2_9PROT|nr:GNAT family N-acetyltransferase [Rhodovastum atsumiense]KAA5609984.1 GNAT family N-acetyltransferase [Rhodovastum atsumiense]CAH2598625.1 GNAT family N-acetyltransferase [Rhodovastum atsumiense]